MNAAKRFDSGGEFSMLSWVWANQGESIGSAHLAITVFSSRWERECCRYAEMAWCSLGAQYRVDDRGIFLIHSVNGTNLCADPSAGTAECDILVPVVIQCLHSRH